MLIIISDIHIGDGTCSQSISAAAFRLFADRLKELAFNASWRADGRYRPLESIEISNVGRHSGSPAFHPVAGSESGSPATSAPGRIPRLRSSPPRSGRSPGPCSKTMPSWLRS